MIITRDSMWEMAVVRPRESPQLSMARPRILSEESSGIDVPMAQGTLGNIVHKELFSTWGLRIQVSVLWEEGICGVVMDFQSYLG